MQKLYCVRLKTIVSMVLYINICVFIYLFKNTWISSRKNVFDAHIKAQMSMQCMVCKKGMKVTWISQR